VSDTDGQTTFFDLSLRAMLYSTHRDETIPDRLQLFAFAGYQYYADELRDRNGAQTLWMEERVDGALKEPQGFNAEYDFGWEAIRVGTGGEYTFGRNLSLSVAAAFLVRADYSGEGFWALREDLSSASPNLVHEASDGHGLDTLVVLSCTPWKSMGFQIGHRWIHWEAGEGVSSIYGADGTVYVSRLDRIESTREGFFIGIFGRM